MKRTKIIVIAAVAVLGLAALGGVAVRASASASAPPSDATTLSTSAEVQETDVNAPDTDLVNEQVGDQSGPDEATAEKADTDGPGGPNDQSGNQVEDGQPDTGATEAE